LVPGVYVVPELNVNCTDPPAVFTLDLLVNAWQPLCEHVVSPGAPVLCGSGPVEYAQARTGMTPNTAAHLATKIVLERSILLSTPRI
jgi:hypothetical protein